MVELADEAARRERVKAALRTPHATFTDKIDAVLTAVLIGLG